MPVTQPTVLERLQRGDYENPHKIEGRPKSHKLRLSLAMYRARAREIEAEFKADLLAEHRLTDHPKADLAYSMAWDQSHSEGLESVAQTFADLVELMTPVADSLDTASFSGFGVFW